MFILTFSTRQTPTVLVKWTYSMYASARRTQFFLRRLGVDSVITTPEKPEPKGLLHGDR